MASKAGQAPAKLAVCDAAAPAPADGAERGPAPRQTGRMRGGGTRARFAASGLDDAPWLAARCGPGQQRRKAWSVLDRFHVEADDIRHRIVDQVFKKVIEVQIALVAY